MKKQYGYLILIFLITAMALVLWRIERTETVVIKEYKSISRAAKIKPDYTSTVIPPNIASLNFAVLEPGSAYLVKISSTNGEPVNVFSKTGSIRIPLEKWKQLLTENQGQELFFDIYVKDKDGQWNRYEKISNRIAEEEIDSYLVYRFMKPIFNWWRKIGIYQRNLSSYDERLILHGSSFNEGCLNCHTFLNNDSRRMTIGIRSDNYGSSTLMATGKKIEKIGAKWGYTSWHPSGRLAAYSMNKVQQFFHETAKEIRDVVDLDSSICYYLVDSQQVKTAPGLSEKDKLETYPTWSPDGRYLYYCSAPILWADRNKVPPERYNEVKYNLMRISYDVEKDEWGQPETVLSAEETGLSILCPRISPDGRFLIFCMCEYGCFPVYQASSDLYIMDLQTPSASSKPSGKYRKLTINSEFSESWHSFSSNSRWLAFSSKQRDGLFTRTYFSYVDKDGKAYKPFILPQKDPAYYDSLLQTYSVPELIKNPVKVSQNALAWAVRQSEKIEVQIPITGATVDAEGSGAWRQER